MVDSNGVTAQRIPLQSVQSTALRRIVTKTYGRRLIKAYRFADGDVTRYMLWSRKRRVGIFEIDGSSVSIAAENPKTAMTKALAVYRTQGRIDTLN